MTPKRKMGFRTKKGLGVGPASWSSSVGKATKVWRSPKKPRTGRSKKGW